MAWLPSSLADDLKTRWPTTEFQQGDFLDTIDRINTIERLAKQNIINREIDLINKVWINKQLEQARSNKQISGLNRLQWNMPLLIQSQVKYDNKIK